MPKETAACGFVFALAFVLLLFMAPGALSLAFVVLMCAACGIAFEFGIHRVARVNQALKHARRSVVHAKDVQSEQTWLVIRQSPRLFEYSVLDRDFDKYRDAVEAARAKGETLLPDIDDYLNEDTVGLATWRAVILQMPGVLTGIGILGTFIGLIIGVGGVGFSSVTAAINGVETLLSGIEIAFFTSIAGLILSILFNLAYRVVWSTMLQNLQRFTRDFQDCVIPSSDAQELAQRQRYQQQVLQLLAANGQRRAE